MASDREQGPTRHHEDHARCHHRREIDIYPEYGQRWRSSFGQADRRGKSAKAGYEKVKALDFAKNRIVWLEPAPANNTWAIAVRKDVAAAHGLKSLADLGKWVAGGGQFKLAASAEFVERRCLPGSRPPADSGWQDQLPRGGRHCERSSRRETDVGCHGRWPTARQGTGRPGLVIMETRRGFSRSYRPPIIRDTLASTEDQAPVFRSWIRRRCRR
jgi:osmoprotectant transport system substrate-binding protein